MAKIYWILHYRSKASGVRFYVKMNLFTIDTLFSVVTFSSKFRGLLWPFKAQLAATLIRCKINGVPRWLWRSASILVDITLIQSYAGEATIWTEPHVPLADPSLFELVRVQMQKWWVSALSYCCRYELVRLHFFAMIGLRHCFFMLFFSSVITHTSGDWLLTRTIGGGPEHR